MQTRSGIRIVTTAVNVPGPVAVAMLREKGAAVVKVEPPHGDPLSRWAPRWYSELCAGVEVLRLDPKSPEGREHLHGLLAAADLLVTSSRPGSLQRLGLSWNDLQARHTRLCHVAIVGYAAPRAHFAVRAAQPALAREAATIIIAGSAGSRRRARRPCHPRRIAAP